MLHSLFYLTTALHVSGVTITHLQEHKTTVTTASGNRYTVLLSAAIVEELELIWVCCGWLISTHSTLSWWTLSGTLCLTTSTNYTFNNLPRMKTRGCQCSFRLLMMGGVSPETYWGSYKYGIIKFWCIVASRWISLYELYYDARIHEQQDSLLCSLVAKSLLQTFSNIQVLWYFKKLNVQDSTWPCSVLQLFRIKLIESV